MQKQKQPVSHSVPLLPNKESKKPSMASLKGAVPTGTSRSDCGGDAEIPVSSPPLEDFEFCVVSSGGLALTGDEVGNMCVAEEVFSGGMLLPLLLLPSDSLDGATTAASTSSGSSSRSDSSSSCVSRSTSAKSASSEPATWSSKSASSTDAVVPPRRSLSSSAFYTHPSPSPRRSGRSGAFAGARRSTGSAPPAVWGVIRLGVVGAPEVYPPRVPAESRKTIAAARGGSGSRSARFEQASAGDKKLALGLLGASLVCSCSPDAVEPVDSAEVAAMETRRRMKKTEEKKRAAAKQRRQSTTSRQNRIFQWLQELSTCKEKRVVV